MCAQRRIPVDQPSASGVHDPTPAPVGADPDRQVPIGRAGGAARGAESMTTIGTPRFCAISDLAQKCHVGGDEVGAPRDDQVAVLDRLISDRALRTG